MLLQATDDAAATQADEARTIWGLNARQLHDQYWAAHGFQVIRPGDNTRICADALGYLLLNPGLMVLFAPERFKDRQSWLRFDLFFLRMHEASSLREHIVTDDASRFVRFERSYRGARPDHFMRIAITNDSRLAGLWQVAPDVQTSVKKLRQVVPRGRRSVASMSGSLYTSKSEQSQLSFLRDLMRVWPNPHSSIQRVVAHHKSVWLDLGTPLPEKTRFIGPVWVGAGRKLDGATMVIGPAVLWDEHSAAPGGQEIVLDPTGGSALAPPIEAPRARKLDRPIYYATKRLFDLAFALTGLALTLPIYPFVILAIWLEDGRPFFFAHNRETLYGQRFGCIKFRSMRRNAEKIKLDLVRENQADGPQFFMKTDPRLTRVGRVLREFHIDELPQFINVLLGHMSVVGPRPSPYRENQFCPPWREARLSVRPGITGLWQVKRTREKDKDFQEWIRYDIEYVEKAGFLLDMAIILQTIATILRRGGSAMVRPRRTSDVSARPSVESPDVLETSS